ncbi:MAG: hypothetical protein P8L68_19015 [Paracoccaceae bacterium]|nr:hypothetical protein [Paracoccaceae bacterium]MDG2260568.1 hypothetical protein [Paracoccaceae bacterium]
MPMRLIVASLSGGPSNKDWKQFKENASELTWKCSGFTKFANPIIISTTMTEEEVKTYLSTNFSDEEALTCCEITRATLENEHHYLSDLVQQFLLPRTTFPNIE